MAQSKFNKGNASRSGASRSGPSRGRGRRRAAASSSARSPRGSQSGRSTRSGKNSPRRKSNHRGLGGEHVEGRHAVRELLIAGNRNVKEVTINQDLDHSGIVEDILNLCDEFRVPVSSLPRRKVDARAVTDSHQGVLATAAPIKPADFDALKAAQNAFLLVLDGVTDPRNLGAILRVADCAGVTGVVLGRHRSVHVTPAVTKTAAGAIEYLPMCIVPGVATAMTSLTEANVTTIGLDGSGSASLFDPTLTIEGSVALVLGAEGVGLSRLVRERTDMVASIPLGGHLGSLNVGTAAAVACYEIVRRRSFEIAEVK